MNVTQHQLIAAGLTVVALLVAGWTASALIADAAAARKAAAGEVRSALVMASSATAPLVAEVIETPGNPFTMRRSGERRGARLPLPPPPPLPAIDLPVLPLPQEAP